MIEHYTRDEVEKSDFIFISYKHTDSQTVEAILSDLFEKGVRFWYDGDLHGGDDWTKTAERLIKHENCKGVIFFNSTDAFLAEAVHNERQWTLERIEADKKKGKEFFVFPANKNGDSHLLLIKKAFDTLEADAITLSQKFPYERLSVITDLFNDRIIYVNSSSVSEAAEKLFESINTNKKLGNVIDTDYLQIKKLETQSEEGETKSFSFGICKDKQENGVPAYKLQNNGVYTEHGEAFIVQDGKAYSTKSIVWRVLGCENDSFILLSEQTVDVRCGGKDLTAWLNGDFKLLCFNDEERGLINRVRLLSAEDIKKYQNDDAQAFAFPEDSESHWWISDMVSGAMQKTVRKNGTVYNSGFNSRTSKAGVRPVVEIQKEDITKLK